MATTWYLEKGAAGTNSGTLANPWKTASAVNGSLMASGDTMLIQGGDYSTEDFGMFFPSKSGITFRINPTATQQAVFNGFSAYQANGCVLDGWLNGTQMIKTIGVYHDVDHSNYTNGIWIRETTTFTVNGIEISQIGWAIDGAEHHGIGIQGAVLYVTITNNYIHETIQDAVNINPNSYDIGTNVFNAFVISHNFIHKCGDDGVQSSYGNITINDNYIDQGDTDLRLGAHPDGIQINPNNDSVLIYNNYFSGFNQYTFIEFCDGPGDIRIYNNVFVEPFPDPLGPRLSSYANRTLNYSARDTYTGTFLYANNTGYNFRYYFACNGGLSNATGCTIIFKNNIFLQCKFVMSNNTAGDLLDSSNVDWTNSVQFYDTDGNPTSTPSDRHKGSCSNQNPAFVDAAGGDFHLTAGAFPVANGVDLSAYFTTDRDGVTRTVPWDSGAYKYTGSTPPAATAGGAIKFGGAFSLG